MSSRLQELQWPFTYFYYITWVWWMTALMWTCGETPLSKLWPGRTSCFILHMANIQFVSTQLSIQSYFWQGLVLFKFIQAQSSVTPNTWGTQKIISPDNNNNTSLKYWNYLLVWVPAHHPPTSLYTPKIVSLIIFSSRFYFAGSKLDYVWQEKPTKRLLLILLMLCVQNTTHPDDFQINSMCITYFSEFLK